MGQSSRSRKESVPFSAKSEKVKWEKLHRQHGRKADCVCLLVTVMSYATTAEQIEV